MSRILIAAVLVGALVQAGAASAGCMATVGLAPPPAQIAPGTVWTAELTVLQHGLNALPNAKTARPTLTIVNTETGAQKTFVARATKNPEVFVAEVVFPTAGSWRYEIYDDFSSEGGEPVPCAQTHTFAAVTIGGPAGGGTPSGPKPAEPVPAAASGDGASFPVWPVAGGALILLALSAGLLWWSIRVRPESVA
jgi:hypothetical protein